MTRTLLAVLAVILLNGCGDPDDVPKPGKKTARPPAPKGEAKKVNVGKNVWLEMLPGNKRRVLVSAEVCQSKGPLELLLTRKGTKEHEAILAADVEARQIHLALETAGARAGTPAVFSPRFQAATGGTVAIDLQWVDADGKPQEARANSWIRNISTLKELETDWVFAGSFLDKDPGDPQAPLRYLANMGDVVSLANFDTAMLDVPFASSKVDVERGYEAWEGRVPPVGTKVVVVMTPLGK